MEPKTLHRFFVLTALALAIVMATYQNAAAGETGLESRFLGDVENVTHDSFPGPSAPQTFLWDFSNQIVREYTYSQIVESSTHMTLPGFDEQQPMSSRISAEGILRVKPTLDQKAKLVLNSMKASMVFDIGDPATETIQRELPTMVLEGMNEDGTITQGPTGADMLLRMVLPLPDRPTSVGASRTIPVSLPVNVMGSPLVATINATVRFTGMVDVNGRQCAQLDAQFDLPEFNLPEEIEGDFEVDVTGAGRYFFDLEDRCLVEAVVAIMMVMDSEMPQSPLMSNSETSAEPEQPLRMYIANDNLVKLSLQ